MGITKGTKETVINLIKSGWPIEGISKFLGINEEVIHYIYWNHKD